MQPKCPRARMPRQAPQSAFLAQPDPERQNRRAATHPTGRAGFSERPCEIRALPRYSSRTCAGCRRCGHAGAGIFGLDNRSAVAAIATGSPGRTSRGYSRKEGSPPMNHRDCRSADQLCLDHEKRESHSRLNAMRDGLPFKVTCPTVVDRNGRRRSRFAGRSHSTASDSSCPLRR